MAMLIGRRTTYAELDDLPDDGILPDLIFVRAEHAHFVADTGCFGAPDLVVEVLSPTSINRDLKAKRETYERFGVANYWVIDPDHGQIHRFQLIQERYEELPMFGRADMLTSPLFPMLDLPIDELFGALSRGAVPQTLQAEAERVRASEALPKSRQHDKPLRGSSGD